LDLLLAGIGALGTCERCIIIKDNAVRLGTTDVTSVNTIQFLVLSRKRGSWAVENIVIDEEDGFTPTTPSVSLDVFVTDSRRDVDALCLTSRTTRSCPAIIHIVRARRTNSVRSSGAHLAQTVQEGIADA
jgi:hypothetical protein